MGEVDSVAPARSRSARRTVGWVAAALAVVMFVVFVLGMWNPADLVVLWRFAGNPFIGAMIVIVLALVAAWLLAPIGSEARQIKRARLRVGLALALVASLLGYLVAGPRFAVKYDVAPTSSACTCGPARASAASTSVTSANRADSRSSP
jgi:heme A synthase